MSSRTTAKTPSRSLPAALRRTSSWSRARHRAKRAPSRAECSAPSTPPGVHSIADLAEFLGVPSERCIKTLLVEGEDGGLVALVLRGDHELNAVKAGRADGVLAPLTFARPERLRDVVGCGPGSLGPVGMDLPVIADASAATIADFVCGANRDGEHLTGVNWGRDTPEPAVADLRNAVDGDPSPDGSGPITIRRGIEVGHIFQLGDKYSTSMGAVVLDDDGRAIHPVMGCYGIGVTRVVAAAIEQNHDEKGIVWPVAIAPFHTALLPMNMHKSVRLREAAEKLYADLTGAGIEVLFDDRRVRPGVMFADSELVGIPHRIVIGDRGLDAGTVEYRHRRDAESTDIALDDIVPHIRALVP